MTLQQPLFMQAGQYTAAADRYLIGAFLFPSGDSTQYPRPGVRPYGTIEVGANIMDQSFRVAEPTGGTTQMGEVEVSQGVAFVAGPTSLALNGVYLVVNTGSEVVNLNATAGAGSSRWVNLYVKVTEGPTVTDSVATFFPVDEDDPEQPTDSVLLLYRVSLDANGRPTTFEDKRVYTTTHGGVLLVNDAVELTDEYEAVSPNPITTAPLGSQAYSIADMALYTRTVNGWEVMTAVKSGLTAERPLEGYTAVGSLYYDTALRILEVYAPESPEAKWLTVGEVPGMARLATSSAYTGERRHSQTMMASWAFQITPTGGGTTTGWVPIHDGSLPTLPSPPGGIHGKPTTTPNQLEVRFLVRAAKTVVTAVLSAEMIVRSKDAWATVDNSCAVEVALEVQKFTGSGTTTAPVDPYKVGSQGTIPWLNWGMRFIGERDGMKSRTVLYELQPGEYIVRPIFHAVSGTATLRTIHVPGMSVEVALP